jgi:hypothetical protein
MALMAIAADNERRFWQAAGVASVAELPGFPFATHGDFTAAVGSSRAAVGIDFSAARSVLGVIESRGMYVFVHLLTWVPIVLGLGSIALAIGRGSWLATLGLPAAAMAYVFASPYNPLQKIVLRFSVVGAAYVLLTGLDGSAFWGIRWAILCFGASMFTLWYLNSLASECARIAVLKSEAFAAFLFKSGNLHIQDAAGQIHSVITHQE